MHHSIIVGKEGLETDSTVPLSAKTRLKAFLMALSSGWAANSVRYGSAGRKTTSDIFSIPKERKTFLTRLSTDNM